MSDAQVDDGTSGRLRRLVTMAGGVVLRGTLYVSPKPMVFVLRKQFASGADALAARLMRDAPSDVVATIDEPYDDDPDALLDVYTPHAAAARGERLPTIVWTHGGAFIGMHGSWNRRPRNGYKLAFVPFAGGRPAGAVEDVLTGFIDDDGRAMGRPAGVAVARDGAVLVADDVGNTVWRVSSQAGMATSR